MQYHIERLSAEHNRGALLDSRNAIQKTFDLQPSEQDFQWTYVQNPAGKATSFMAKNDENGEYFGIFTAFPRIVSIDKVKLKAAVLGEFMVKRGYRFLGPAIKLCREITTLVANSELDLVYGFANDSAAPIMRRAGFTELGRLTRKVKIVNTHKHLKKIMVIKSLSSFLSIFADFFLKSFSLETWCRFSNKFYFREIENIDGSFDELWSEKKSPTKAMVERSSGYIIWRFFGRPDVAYHLLAFKRKVDHKLHGYLIYHMESEVAVIDDFFLPEGKKFARVFLAQSLRTIRKSHSPESIYLEAPNGHEILSQIQGFNFFSRDSDLIFFVYCNQGFIKKYPFLKNAESWAFTPGDNHV